MAQRLLLFDTLKLTQLRLTLAFQGSDIQLQAVSSLEEAMRGVLSEPKPSAMLLSLHLVGLDGHEVARAFKLWSPLPLIVYSIDAPEILQKTAREIGANGSVSLLAPDKEIVAEVLRAISPSAPEVKHPSATPSAPISTFTPPAKPKTNPESTPKTNPEPVPPRFLDAVSDLLPESARTLAPPTPARALAAVTTPARAVPVLKLAPAPGLKKSSILLIDDDPGQLFFQRLLLRDSDLQCLEGGSGQDALKLARQHIPDLLLLDFMMPGMDGLEVISRLRAEPITARIPVLLTVTQVEVAYVNQRRHELQFEVLVKPLDEEDLKKKMRALLKV